MNMDLQIRCQGFRKALYGLDDWPPSVISPGETASSCVSYCLLISAGDSMVQQHDTLSNRVLEHAFVT